MALLYHWRDENFNADTADAPEEVALQQNAPWLGQATEEGQRLWTFTRNAQGRYVLASHFIVGRIIARDRAGRYGKYEVQPQTGTTVWYETGAAPSFEPILRGLSIAPRARVLGHSFQGYSAVRRLTKADDRALVEFAARVPVRRALVSETTQSAHKRGTHRGSGYAATLYWDVEGMWTDVLPLTFFAGECHERHVEHAVVSAETPSGSSLAQCLLTVAGKTMTLDYAAPSVRDSNQIRAMDIGVLVLRFADEARTELLDGTWRPVGGAPDYAPVRIEWPAAPSRAPYALPSSSAPIHRAALRKERHGQVHFRAELEAAYGSVCALSGCTVPEALEAAHIDPHDGPGFDHRQNGLLLRRDLHALMDAGLLAIDPDSLIAYFAPGDARTTYRDLHGRAKLRPPHPAMASCAPARAALARRWQAWGVRFGQTSSSRRSSSRSS